MTLGMEWIKGRMFGEQQGTGWTKGETFQEWQEQIEQRQALGMMADEMRAVTDDDNDG